MISSARLRMQFSAMTVVLAALDGQSFAAVCGGVAGYPANPSTGAAVCPPYTNPIVFFAPHPDDETLGMAGAIRAAKAANRTVIVELMTHGEGSGNCTTYFPTADACGTARVNEFTEAMIRLGVDGVVGGQDGGNNFGDKHLLYSNGAANPDIGSESSYCTYPDLSANPGVVSRVNWWISHGGSGLSLRGTSGNDFICHPDHLAVSMAIANSGFSDTNYYQVYRISDGNRNTAATSTDWRGNTVTLYRTNTNAYCGTPSATDCTYPSNRGSGKRGGLWAYTTVCTSAGLYGYAWQHSTGSYFDGYDADCVNGVANEYTDKPVSSGSSGACGEASCVAPQGDYVSHYTGANCTGTESYYTPYFTGGTTGVPGNCQPNLATGALCGTQLRTVTNISARINGSCTNYWPSGNTLSGFVTVYRANKCGEASCVSPQGDYISHFTGPGCTGTESYYTPYFTGGTTGVPGNCQPNLATGAVCGTVLRTVTNISARVNGVCNDYWPGGNTLSGFVTVYR